MNHTFIHLGCEVKIAGNKVTITKPDGSIENKTLRFAVDHDISEEFIKDYIAITIVKQ
jgi:hypothetical protein